jgi:hypothetical protein
MEEEAMSTPEPNSLEARVRELEDVRAITDLFFKWHYECTGGFNGKQAGRMEALEVLSEDATIEVQGMHEPGKGPKGRAQYTEFWDFFYGDDGPLPYVFQTSVADKVVITGDTAIHKTNMLGIFQNRAPDGKGLAKATIGLSQRTNTCIRTKDGWRIQKTTVEGGLSTSVDQLHGNLNKLPDIMSARTPWSYKG